MSQEEGCHRAVIPGTHARTGNAGPGAGSSALPAFPPASAPGMLGHTLKGTLTFPGHSEGMFIPQNYLKE